MKVLVEGIGSMVFGPQYNYYKQMNWELVGIDITSKSFGLYKDLTPYIVLKYSDSDCFNVIENIIKKENIDLVFPTINEGLLEWSRKKKYFRDEYNTNVIISDEKVVDICTDKWKTYLFFEENDIPTPNTSLEMKYDLLKPRSGRGSVGIYRKNEVDSDFDMEGYISQEFIKGEEYTIDVLCDFKSNPIYIIPRKRIGVESGVSIKGKTVYDKDIIKYTEKIIEALKPIGIINLQCIKKEEKNYFIEINPRIAGGSSLSFASSDNWFKAIDKFIKGDNYDSKDIVFNNYMFRYFNDIIVQEEDLVK